MKRREMAERIERLETLVADLTLRTRRERPARLPDVAALTEFDIIGPTAADIRELDRRIMRARRRYAAEHGTP